MGKETEEPPGNFTGTEDEPSSILQNGYYAASA
jgi:hypothetical protein